MLAMGVVVALAVSKPLRRLFNQALCVHDPHLKSDGAAGLVWQECTKCGHVTPGWRVDIDARFPTSKKATVTRARQESSNVKRFYSSGK